MPRLAYLVVAAGLAVAIGSAGALCQAEKGAAAAGAAQPPKAADAKVDPEATKMLEAAKAAGKAVKDMSAVVESEVKGGEDAPPRMKGKVVATFKNGAMFPLGMWRIERQGDEKAGDATAPRVMAYDGKVMRSIDPEAKEMQEMEPPMGFAMPMDDSVMLLPMWFLEQRQGMGWDAAKVVEASVVEGKEIGGVKCRGVRQVREMAMPGGMGEAGEDGQKVVQATTVYLGEDNLPRRVETVLTVPGSEEEGGGKHEMVQTFTDLKVDQSPEPASFALTAPEGYKTTKVDPGSDEQPGLKVSVGDAAPEFSLKDAAGKEYTQSGLKGKVVLLDFWATWCGPCKAAMPSIQKIHEHFKDKPVAVLGVNTWEKKADAGPKFMDDKGYTYPCLLKGDGLAKSYGVTGIPTLVLIDQDGKVLHTGVGFGPGEEEHLIEMIEGQLKK